MAAIAIAIAIATTAIHYHHSPCRCSRWPCLQITTARSLALSRSLSRPTSASLLASAGPITLRPFRLQASAPAPNRCPHGSRLGKLWGRSLLSSVHTRLASSLASFSLYFRCLALPCLALPCLASAVYTLTSTRLLIHSSTRAGCTHAALRAQ